MKETEEVKLANIISIHCVKLKLPNTPLNGKYVIDDVFDLIKAIDNYYYKKYKTNEI